METNNEKKCAYCKKIIRGRTDKKFCNDYCRNYFNYQLKTKAGGNEKEINQILSSNRRILQMLSVSGGYIRIEKESLLSMGFDRRYCTELIPIKSGGFCFACYDYAYLMPQKNQVIIFEKKKIRRSASVLPDDKAVV
jgi:hypothetical protein